jgi:hypothetical protein
MRVRTILASFVAVCWVLTGAAAADVTKPAEVSGLRVDRSADDAVLTWDAVTEDAAGNAETVSGYRVYRGTTPDFVPDLASGSNRVAEVLGASFSDPGALTASDPYHYLVTAVDGFGNESASSASWVTVPPVLSGSWTETTVELTWSAASPSTEVGRYLVYYGTAPGRYTQIKDVGLNLATSMSGLAAETAYYFAVVAEDVRGNQGAFSNEHAEAVAGRVRFRAHDEDYLCWGASRCPPRPGVVQRADGWQLMVPVDFPAGDWTKVSLTFTMDSRLCVAGQNGCTNKCGEDAAQGGYNPCGDPWDRTAEVFLVVDETCIQSGGSCVNGNNLELLHAVTPFGTDAPPPAGSGVVPPRVLSMDITPYVPLLQGRKYVGAQIGHYVQAGWHVTTEFVFSKRPEEASPKPPADGIVLVGWGDAPLPTKSVPIPATASQVKMRLFVSGHGGTLYCDGGSNDGAACTSNANCPGGTCQNCDEFCHRTNRILKNGAAVWTTVPWRECCVPGYPGDPFCQGCTQWNACGYPSCTFDRAGWCPGYVACHKDPPCDQDLDMTAHFPPGGTYDIGYDVLVKRGSWSISLALYWYE